MGNFFDFDKMITPSLVKVFFYTGLAMSVLLGLALIGTGMNGSGDGSLGLIFIGMISLVFGPILVRINCELFIVIFKIHESLVEIKNK